MGNQSMITKIVAILWLPVIPAAIVAHYTYDAIAILVYATIGIVLTLMVTRMESREEPER